MSAFICSDYHVTLLAAVHVWLRAGGRPQFDKLAISAIQDVAELLHAENVASVNYRYRESSLPAYRFEKRAVSDLLYRCAVDGFLLEVAKGADCLEYQSCEHPGWAESAACGILTGLRLAILTRLASRCETWTLEPRPAARRAAA